MNFQMFYLNENVIPNWKSLVNNNEYLKTAVEILNILDTKFKGSSTYIVGGTVRDLAKGNDKFDDIDIATNVDIDEIEKLFKSHDIGQNKKFQIVVINYKGFEFEIAHFRIESGYSDNRRPDEVKPVKDFKTDASRRDMTWNAMGLDKFGNIVDHFGGIKDIQNKILRMVGNPEERLKEDSLRLIRCARFATKLGFTIDIETMEAIKKQSPNILKVAPERIWKELFKLAGSIGSKFANGIEILKESGLLGYILPEILELDSYVHNTKYHPEGNGNVLSHVLSALKQYKSNNPLVNLSILFHDVGKPSTYAYNDGAHNYHGHSSAALPIIENICKRLKIDNETKECLQYVAEYHMNVWEFPKMNNNTIYKIMQSKWFDILLQVAECDSKARLDVFNPKEWQEVLDKVEEMKGKFANKQFVDQIKKLVNGHIVMDLLDLKPSDGIQIGKVIKNVTNWIINNNIDLSDVDKINNYILQWKDK